MEHRELGKKLQSLQIPEPSETAKDQAVALAVQAFETHQEKIRKGSMETIRLTYTTTWWQRLTRSFSMKKIYVYSGSFAAVAVALCITTIHYSTIMEPVVGSQKPTEEVKIEGASVQPEAKYDDAAGQVNQAAPGMQAELESVLANPELKAKDMASGRVDQATPGMQADMKAHAPMIAYAPPAPPPPAAPAAADSLNSVVGSAAPQAVMKRQRNSEAKAKMDYQAPGMPTESIALYEPTPSGDKFESVADNGVKQVAAEPVSTFSIDVDTASYSFVRRVLNANQMPDREMVRVEEMINYFPYNYALPQSKSEPFKPSITVAPSPWNANNKLVHIGIKGYELHGKKPAANLVFLIDVSGSMNAPDKLPLVKTSLKMLVEQMDAKDTISIVTYAGYSGVALSPTSGADKQKILSVIDQLGAGGGTAGAAGIEEAYKLAQEHFNKDSVNRVILATDGDFNVGVSDNNSLENIIKQKRESGIFLSVLGFGQGNYNDALMQTLAQHGNGNAAYIDNANEARKVLVNEAGATLFAIAKDVKLQVEFNPKKVASYRLIGYESRMLNREDFNNDKVDAGEVGAGHAVTAIYEITPAGNVDALRYDNAKPQPTESQFSGEYGFLKIRYKLPNESTSKLITAPINNAVEVADINAASPDVRFTAAVAGFGQILKGDSAVAGYSYDQVATLAGSARGDDAFGYRGEFLNLVQAAKNIGQPIPMPAPGMQPRGLD